MIDKKIKRLSRSELLEILVTQGEEIERLNEELEESKRIIEERTITIKRAGSIANAALDLNGVFESAQKAANEYLLNIKRLNDRQVLISKRIEKESREKAQSMINHTAAKCESMLKATQAKCEMMLNHAGNAIRNNNPKA